MKHIGGIILIVVGCLFLFNNFGWYDFGDFIADFWPLALIIVGIYLIYTKFHSDKNSEDWEHCVSKKNYKSMGSKKIKPEKIPTEGLKTEVGLGELHLDLSETQFSLGENKISASVGTGELDIKIPKEIAVKVTCNASVGSIYIFGEKYEGFGENESYTDPNYATAEKKVLIIAKVGMGEMKIHHP